MGLGWPTGVATAVTVAPLECTTQPTLRLLRAHTTVPAAVPERKPGVGWWHAWSPPSAGQSHACAVTLHCSPAVVHQLPPQPLPLTPPPPCQGLRKIPQHQPSTKSSWWGLEVWASLLLHSSLCMMRWILLLNVILHRLYILSICYSTLKAYCT